MKYLKPKIYYKNLPRKTIAVGILFFDSAKRLLLVKPTYKELWSIPGGVVEQDESLKQALKREVKEEINLNLNFKKVKLAVLDYLPKTLIDKITKPESLQIIFYGGALSKKQQAQIKIDRDELSDWRFVPIKEAQKLLPTRLKRRINSYLKQKSAVYLEDGRAAK